MINTVSIRCRNVPEWRDTRRSGGSWASLMSHIQAATERQRPAADQAPGALVVADQHQARRIRCRC